MAINGAAPHYLYRERRSSLPWSPIPMSFNTNNWPYLGLHPAPSASSSSSSPLGGAGPMEAPAAASWADEFLEFSAARRFHHRRAASETAAAFLDDAVACASDFGRLDDVQLMSIFSDPIPPPLLSSPSPSSTTPYDQNSVQEDRAPTPAGGQEGQSLFRTQAAAAEAASELIADPRRVRRILANRQSAQRSRVRKLHYIAELELSVTRLQSQVSALTPRLAFLDQQRSVLAVGNSHLRQRIAALAQDNIFKDAQQEALKKELERLRQLYHQQNIEQITTPNPEPVVRNYFNDLAEDNSCM